MGGSTHESRCFIRNEHTTRHRGCEGVQARPPEGARAHRFVDFYLSGKLHLDDMISRRIKLEDVNEGLQALKTGEVARSVIVFD